jgi:alcohol dehydrogenase class IV
MIMDQVIFNNPVKMVLGAGCFKQFVEDLSINGLKRLFVLGIPVMESMLETRFQSLPDQGIEIKIFTGIEQEPSFGDLERVVEIAKEFGADGIAGIGGGSVLDTAKLLAVMLKGDQSIKEVTGINLIKGRTTFLACIPTTSGTGSEVSPNAIFYDEESNSKQGVISPHLVPDAAYIDPELTISLPSAETAATGMDALTHCIEAFANRFAHPVVDRIALEGIRLIGNSLKTAYENGQDISARTDLALGSMYGGMCLGPVNTAAVHALAYPLGSIFKIGHGVSNALLLPHVLRFNLPGATDRYSEIAMALGVEPKTDPMETALEGIRKIEQMMKECNLPLRLSDINIRENDLDGMTDSAMKITRLLKNNPRELSSADARRIYMEAL